MHLAPVLPTKCRDLGNEFITNSREDLRDHGQSLLPMLLSEHLSCVGKGAFQVRTRAEHVDTERSPGSLNHVVFVRLVAIIMQLL